MQSSMTRPGSMPLLSEAEKAPPKNTSRLVILGSAKVGKTSIVSRFLCNKFDEKYTPTIEDFHRKIYRIRGEAYRLDILDTSGNHPFPAMRRLSLLTGDIFILVYATDNRESFDEVKRLREQIMECKLSSAPSNATPLKKKRVIPMIIVGNKCDKEEREVGIDELKELADSWPGCGYLETSAKKNIDIDEIFIKLFLLAKLPSEMSPSLHRKVHPTYIGHSPGSIRRGVTLRRRLSDACGAVAPNARRPSIRTDLLILQTKQFGGSFDHTETEAKREARACVIQ